MDNIGWPDFLIAGAAAYAQYYAHNAEVNAAAEAAGTKTILIERADPDTGLTRGLVEMAEKYEELATFLGADAAGHSAADKRLLCSAAESFKHVAKAAHATSFANYLDVDQPKLLLRAVTAAATPSVPQRAPHRSV